MLCFAFLPAAGQIPHSSSDCEVTSTSRVRASHLCTSSPKKSSFQCLPLPCSALRHCLRTTSPSIAASGRTTTSANTTHRSKPFLLHCHPSKSSARLSHLILLTHILNSYFWCTMANVWFPYRMRCLDTNITLFGTKLFARAWIAGAFGDGWRRLNQSRKKPNRRASLFARPLRILGPVLVCLSFHPSNE